MIDGMDQRVAQTLEAQLASELNALLTGVSVGSEFIVAPSLPLCSSLELFIPKVLSRHYPEWMTESLDGVFVASARKTEPTAAEFAGTCILISDQTVTPLLVELILSSSKERIASVRVCLGEPGGGRLQISGPSCNSVEANELLATVVSRLGSIAWSYKVTENGGSAEGDEKTAPGTLSGGP